MRVSARHSTGRQELQNPFRNRAGDHEIHIHALNPGDSRTPDGGYKELESKLGELPCEGSTGRLEVKQGTDELEAKLDLHGKAPFGVVTLKFKLKTVPILGSCYNSRMLPSQEGKGRSDSDSLGSTRWSVVLAAGDRNASASQEALEILCQTYWYPLYAYVRRRVRTAEEAQDLTQAFFAKLLEKEYLAEARPERGRFRAFLLTALKHFLANEWDKVGAQKRGGGRTILSLDFAHGEAQYALQRVDAATPERLFDQQWAVSLINRVLERLREERSSAGQTELFDTLKSYLAGVPQATSYADAAAKLGMDKSAVRVRVHRLRKRYRELLRAEIAQTVAHPGDVDDEIGQLFATLQS